MIKGGNYMRKYIIEILYQKIPNLVLILALQLKWLFYIFISRNGKVECLSSNMGSFCKINSWQGLLLTTHFIIRSPQMTSFTSEKVMKSKSIKSKLAVLWSHLFPNIKDFIVTLGKKYLVSFSSRSPKMREKYISFAQFVHFWRKCVYFSTFEW